MLVPRQTTPYTCGAACLAMIAKLCTKPFSEMDIAKQCNAQPNVGIDNPVLENWAKQHFSVSHRKDVYPAIWNIRNPLSGIGHYVVVLGERNGIVRYYDPLYARVLAYPKAEIDWQSGCGTHQQWSIAFDGIPDHYDTSFVGEAFLDTPAGLPVASFMYNSVLRYLDKNSPTTVPY